MASIINTNMASLFSQRSLSKSHDALHTSLERLSSGSRINKAGDDAAGMLVAERMFAQMNGIGQAARNAHDGISMMQTAEGGLTDITTSLQRIRTLAVQSANASNTSLDRSALQTESKQLTEEIDRISSHINFNGIKLLDGSFKNQKFQIGANAHQTIAMGVNNIRTTKLGVTDATSLSSKQGFMASANANADDVSLKYGDLVINGISISTPLEGDDVNSSNNKTLSAIAKAATINKVANLTGVSATANENMARGVSMSALAANTSATFMINGIAITSTISSNNAATRGAVVDAINAKIGQTGVLAINTDNNTEGVVLKAADGRNIDVSSSVNSAATGIKTGFFIGSYTLTSSTSINLQEGPGNIAHAGFSKGNYDPQTAYASNAAVSDSGTDVTGNKTARTVAFLTGDFKLNGILVGASRAADDLASTHNNSASAIAKAVAINRLTSLTGVTANANATEVRGSSDGMISANASGQLSINGTATDTITISTTATTSVARQDTAKVINAIAKRTGVVAVDSGTDTFGVKLIAEDGRNIVISNNGGGITAAFTGLGTVQNSYYASLTLSSGKSFTISVGTQNEIDIPTPITATKNGLDHLGMGAATYGGSRTGSALADIDLSTAEGATIALSAVDNAVNTINTQRSNLGALQNRFYSTVSNLGSSGDNLSSAHSRIKDADFAQETAKITRNQIIRLSSGAMLS